LFEYFLQVPANRIGHTAMNLGQLKILQEVITVVMFCAIRVFLYGSTPKLELFVDRIMFAGRGLFYFQGIKPAPIPGLNHRTSCWFAGNSAVAA